MSLHTPSVDFAEHTHAGGAWRMWSRPPVDGPGPLVRNYCAFTERSATVTRRRELPSGLVHLIVTLGTPLAIFDPRTPGAPPKQGRVFVAALDERHAPTESARALDCVEVKLTPLGARRLLGVPMHLVTNQVVELDDLIGGDAHRLVDRLRHASDWETRLTLVETFVQRRIALAPPASGGIAWAWGELMRRRGRLETGSLARELGWSRKHLIAQFREHVGLPPKVFARLLRFNHAIEHVRAGGMRDWVDLAALCGYYDQAHFINDFRDFSGTTPSDLVRHLIPNGGGVYAPDAADGGESGGAGSRGR